MNSFKISVGKLIYDPSKATRFKCEKVRKEQLEETFKTYNYSLITWGIKDDIKDQVFNRYRTSNNFESASGFVIDIDEGLTIFDAQQRLLALNLNYVIITSKSHQKVKNGKPAADRFHIIIFFDKPTSSIGKYRGVYAKMLEVFPEMDTMLKDLARFIFGSPEDALYRECFDGEFLKIDDVDEALDLRTIDDKLNRTVWEFDPSMEIKLADGRFVKVNDIRSKEACYCPHPDHDDNNPSAFVSYIPEKDKYMIYCTSDKCGAIGWSECTTFEASMQERCDDFYFLGKDILEMGVADSQFYATKTSKDAFFILVNANKEQEQEAAFRYLVENKRVSNLARVDYAGDVDAASDGYQVDLDIGVIDISIAGIKSNVKDNAFIEEYLERTFGAHRDFIKKYIAMYVYTNYVQLPTLILHGSRGSSKSTFAQLIGSIYPNLYIDWRGEVGNFTPEAEKKLAVIEENELNEKTQYKILKKYTGQKQLLVNKKYQPEYMVRNNINIIWVCT